MKVVKSSNYNLDNYPEELASFENLTKKEAKDIAEELNRPLVQDCPFWYIVVKDDYVLQEDLNT